MSPRSGDTKAQTNYRKIERCRICGNPSLELVLDLGEQVLTGVFPRAPDPAITRGPLQLVKCIGAGTCGLLQLAHTFDLGEMYGENYGYRSGLNPSMVAHLHAKVEKIMEMIDLKPGDLVVDIGSNDGTTLGAYPEWLSLVGIDPTSAKFKEFFPSHAKLIPDFFTAGLLLSHFPSQKAKVVTSFSMFYDLDSPMSFMRDVYDVLADDGLWVFEQSYMPAMLEANSYDTVCHEHLEYYALEQVEWMAERVGFKLIDVQFNDVNGGSFSVIAAKANADGHATSDAVRAVILSERDSGLSTLTPFLRFAERTAASRNALREFLHKARADGKTVAALGASTKGNVILQYCDIGADDLIAIGEVNPDKFGHVTPGTWIGIVPEAEILALHPDFLIVLPWHFRSFFQGSEVLADQRLVFPLPNLEILSPRQ